MADSFFYRANRFKFFLICGILILFLNIFQAFSQTQNIKILRVEIEDQNKNLISEANVKLVFDSGKESICVNNQNEFSCEIFLSESFTLEARAEGFSILRQKFVFPQDFAEKVRFTLSPGDLNEEVFVTANRTETRLGETAASIVSLSRTEIETSAAPTIDDKLRQVAGFSLFRRTGSRYANPTSQGVSLRGVGASGASRSLVSFDGVPLNDVFGGWILWNRVAPIEVERVEVLRGGASSLYGSDSLSGAINILPRKVSDDYALSAEIFGGNQKTFSGSTFFGFKKNNWSADFSAAHFQTQGYILTDETVRGSVDSFAGSRNANFSGRIARNFGKTTNLFFKTSYFGESRTNGTPAQINRTGLREFIFGGDSSTQDSRFKIQNLKFDWRIFGGTQTYDQTFSSVSANRNSESLIRLQRVPAQNFGFSGQVSGVFLKNQTFVFGAEAREVRGASDEIGFFNNNATSVSNASGSERTFGIFFQDFARIGSKFILAGSVRFDDWKNFRASNSVKTLATNQTATINFADRNEHAFSPQISALYQFSERFSIFALASKSFRAPTLNELYRSFRVGNVVTNANENLKAETATNFETGANFNRNNFYVRGNFFLAEIKNPVANVTLSAAPNLITRQRRNAGKTRATGIEIEAEKRFREFSFALGYLLSDSRVTEFPANRELENLFIPQVAKHQFTFQTNYTRESWTLAFQGRASSKQFDDDLNTFELEPFFQLDLFASKRFKENWKIFAAVENLFNSRYSIAKTPIRNVSAPTTFRLGLRFK